MRLHLKGNINRLYVQSLCMMFFRGEKFPENEENPRAELFVELVEKENNLFCSAELKLESRTEKHELFESVCNIEPYDRLCKTAVGKAVLAVLNKATGYMPPWGLLTGIRPSVVAAELIYMLGEEKAVTELIDRYMLTPQKANLAVTVAKNEQKILQSYDETTCSIYISVPFCPTRCSYCSFISYATKKLFLLIPEYVDRIIEEIKEAFKLISTLNLRLASVYIGGGTPTTLNAEQLDRILSTVTNCLCGAKLDEFTVESGRPDTISEEKLQVIKKYGVDRISINPQTLNDDALKSIGRRHTVSDFYGAYKTAVNVGFDVINTDLIAGLDSDNLQSFKNTIDEIVKLSPQNVTVHAFSVKKSAQALADDREIYNREDLYATKSVDYAYDALTSNGYVPYYMYRQKNTVADLENVGYARSDAFGIYNTLMMGDGHTVFGIGAGATTKLIKNVNGKKEILRIFSPKYPYEYLQDKQSQSDKILSFLKGGKDNEKD